MQAISIQTGGLCLCTVAICALNVFAASPRGVIAGPNITEVKTLEQNWTDEEASRFYNIPQGSYFFRYEWFLNLEQANSVVLFRDNSNIRSYGYLPREADNDNPHGLPVGFTKDDKPIEGNVTESYLGITCAACHTGQVNFKQKTYLIDGAPASADLTKFMKELVVAVHATLDDTDKFERFATSVLGNAASADDKAQLKTDLRAGANARTEYNERNTPAAGKTPFGPGRIDAFGAILNEVAVRFAEVPNNQAPADAPVSFPVLWDAPHHDFVQWNGAAENKRSQVTNALVGTDAIGALGRNTGEVLGVFGEIDAATEPSVIDFKHYPNSAKRSNLVEIELSLRELWSPKWPDEFPPINKALRKQGATLFKNARCASCHASINRTDEDRVVVARLSDEGTDPRMARNFLTRKAKTGVLFGRRIEPLSVKLDRFAEEAPVGLMLKHLVQRAIVRPPLEHLQPQQIGTLLAEVNTAVDYQISGEVPIGDATSSIEVAGRFGFGNNGGIKERIHDIHGRLIKIVEEQHSQLNEPMPMIKLNYKARPLNGIWASAPYFHNGSIPNLDELLKRPSERSKNAFKTGSREFDVEKVGFRTDEGEVFDPKLDGNLNVGHDYCHDDGTSFTEVERRQLIEYMKSL